MGKGGADLADCAYPSVRYQPVYDVPGRLVARPDRLCHEHSFLLCEIQYLLCLESIGHERFLDKTSLAFSDGFHRHVKMVRVRGGDIYKVHFRVVKKLAVRPISFGNPEFSGESLGFIQGS